MPSWPDGSGFRIVGCVVRKFAAPSGKFARLTVDVNQSPHPAKLDLRTFDPSLVADVAQLQAGQKVQARGRIETEKLKTREREEVKVDGYAHWSTVLTLLSLEIEGSGRRSEPEAGETIGDDGQDPFAAPPPAAGDNPFGAPAENPFGK